jgi:hypothetical protein
MSELSETAIVDQPEIVHWSDRRGPLVGDHHRPAVSASSPLASAAVAVAPGPPVCEGGADRPQEARATTAASSFSSSNHRTNQEPINAHDH